MSSDVQKFGSRGNPLADATHSSELALGTGGSSLALGTRGSPLALWQAERVTQLLQEHHPDLTIERVIIHTEGDRDQASSLTQIGGQGVFTKAIEDALLQKKIDLAVHSLKDLPSTLTQGLVLGCVPKRGPVEDLLVSVRGYELSSLPQGARVATGSIRRRAQLLAQRPDLQMQDLRGNIQTRLQKLRDNGWDAIVMARAAVERLELRDQSNDLQYTILPADTMIPGVGQGALGLEVRKEDQWIQDLLEPINDAQSFLSVSAERAFLAELDSGCQFPVGALAQRSLKTGLMINGWVGAEDGRTTLHKKRLIHLVCGTEDEEPACSEQNIALAEMMGRDCARDLLARGAGQLLQSGQTGQQALDIESDKAIVLLTRDRNACVRDAEKWKQAGADPLVFPQIEFQSMIGDSDFNPPELWGNRPGADVVIFSSVRAVEFFLEWYKGVKITEDTVGNSVAKFSANYRFVVNPGNVRVICVGIQTAGVWNLNKPSGWHTAMYPLESSAAGVLKMLDTFWIMGDDLEDASEDLNSHFHEDDLLSNKLAQAKQTRVLLPRSDIARPELEEGLVQRGCKVFPMPLYRTVAPQHAPAREKLVRETLENGDVNVLTFYSPSAVQYFVQWWGGDLSLLIRQNKTKESEAQRLIVLTCGSTTAAAAAEIGFEVLQSERPSAESMIAAWQKQAQEQS